jgi:ribulose-phosphate 3-epimerase
MAELAPSVIAADFGALGSSLGAVERFSKCWHVDVMDGHYVPNLTIGPMIVEAIARVSSLPQDVHLMISNVDETWEWYAKAGARRIAFHADQSEDAAGLLKTMSATGIGPGLAVNPDVPVSAVEPLIDLVDHVIVMSVFPGFSGQAFIPDVVPKLTELKRVAPRVELYIDGGVSPKTAPECVAAGADLLVSASAIFGAGDPASVAAEMLKIGRDG